MVIQSGLTVVMNLVIIRFYCIGKIVSALKLNLEANFMKKRFFILAATCTALGILGAQSTAKPAKVSASYYGVKSINRNKLPYHATSRRSAYIYNATHTQKLHNLRNYPRTTWYVSKSILMRSNYTGKKSVYYYVSNGAGTVSGIVWRGYLTSGTNPKTTSGATPTGKNTGSNDNSSSNDNNRSSGNDSNTTDQNYSNNTNKFNETDAGPFKKQILQLFPNLVEDQKLDELAEYAVSLDEQYNYSDSQAYWSKRLIQLYGGEPQGLLQNWNFIKQPNISLVKDQLVNHSNEINYSNLSNYNGYHIGIAVKATSSNSDSNNIEKINYRIYLLPANPKVITTANSN